jgi:hypothetical protein
MKLPNRLKLLYWLIKITKVPEGEVFPLWIRILYFILDPLRVIYSHQRELRFDILTNTITIGKTVYSMRFFDEFSFLAHSGEKFEFEARTSTLGQNFITIRKLSHAEISSSRHQENDEPNVDLSEMSYNNHFREQIAMELSRDELIDRLCEMNDRYQEMRKDWLNTLIDTNNP